MIASSAAPPPRIAFLIASNNLACSSKNSLDPRIAARTSSALALNAHGLASSDPAVAFSMVGRKSPCAAGFGHGHVESEIRLAPQGLAGAHGCVSICLQRVLDLSRSRGAGAQGPP